MAERRLGLSSTREPFKHASSLPDVILEMGFQPLHHRRLHAPRLALKHLGRSNVRNGWKADIRKWRLGRYRPLQPNLAHRRRDAMS